MIKRIFDRASVEQSPHCLRKTGATLYYIESDYDLIATQHFLGHANPSTTREYIGLTSEQVVEYAERMSNHLFSAIEHGKLDSDNNMFDFSQASDFKLLSELKNRGYCVDEFIPDRKEAEVIQFPKTG